MPIIQDYLSLTPCNFFEQPPVKKCLVRFIQKYGNTGGGGGSAPPNLLIAATDASGNIVDGVPNATLQRITDTGNTMDNCLVITGSEMISDPSVYLTLGYNSGGTSIIAASDNVGNPGQLIINTGGFSVASTEPSIFSTRVKGSDATEADDFVTLGQLNTRRLTAAQTLDFPDTPGGDSSDLTITVTGAEEGDPVALGVPNTAMFDQTFYVAWVSSNNTVTVRFMNISLASVNPPSVEFKVVVSKF